MEMGGLLDIFIAPGAKGERILAYSCQSNFDTVSSVSDWDARAIPPSVCVRALRRDAGMVHGSAPGMAGAGGEPFIGAAPIRRFGGGGPAGVHRQSIAHPVAKGRLVCAALDIACDLAGPVSMHLPAARRRNAVHFRRHEGPSYSA